MQQTIKQFIRCWMLLITIFSITYSYAALTAPKISNDDKNIYFSFTENKSYPYYQVYIDTDLNSANGYYISGIGADRLIENKTLYKQSGGTGWKWSKIQDITYSNSAGLNQWTMPLSTLGASLVCNTPIKVVFRAGNNNSGDVSTVVNYNLVLGTNCGGGNGGGTNVITNLNASSTTDQFTFSYQVSNPQQTYRVYLDTDQSASSGSAQGGLGAEFKLEGTTLYSYVAASKSWLKVKDVTFTNTENVLTWTLNRSDVNVSDAMDCAGALDYVYQIVSNTTNITTTGTKATLTYPANSSCNTPVPPPTPPVTGPIAVGTTWNYVLTSNPDLTIKAGVYDIDGFNTTASTVTSVHAAGSKAICYISAGSWENWRSDANSFPASVKGSSNGWPGEVWLDIRQISILGPIMEARLDMCKTKGFDAVEFDNVDGYTNKTGFPLTATDQIAYNTYLANAAHARGLSAALKNDIDQVKDLISVFDFAINEQCFQYDECDTLKPFISANKAVLNVEYSGSTSTFCPQAKTLKFSSILKDLDLDNPVTFCS
jgi:hypothetical protein